MKIYMKKTIVTLLFTLAAIIGCAQNKIGTLAGTMWRNEQTGDWDIGFTEKYAIYDCRLWDYGNLKRINDKFEVTLVNPVGFWEQLLSFSVFYPVRADVVANENWADDVSTYVCNGAFVLGDWVHDSTATIKKRADYHAANEVWIDEIVWYFSDNAVTNLNNYESGSWDYITDIPRQETERLETEYADEYHVASTASAFFLMFNATFDMLPS
jgi:oligopeptide transport system substrate-binding protein